VDMNVTSVVEFFATEPVAFLSDLRKFFAEI
jgi:hypothetical protein